MRAVRDTFPHSRRRQSLAVTIFFATGVIRVIKRIGHDWRSIPNCPIGDGDSENARSNVFIFGYQHAVNPEFLPEFAFPVPAPQPLEIPQWFEKKMDAIIEKESGGKQD